MPIDRATVMNRLPAELQQAMAAHNYTPDLPFLQIMADMHGQPSPDTVVTLSTAVTNGLIQSPQETARLLGVATSPQAVGAAALRVARQKLVSELPAATQYVHYVASVGPDNAAHLSHLNEANEHISIRLVNPRVEQSDLDEILYGQDKNMTMVTTAKGTSVYTEKFATRYDEAGQLVAIETATQDYMEPGNPRVEAYLGIRSRLGSLSMSKEESTAYFRHAAR